MAPGSPGAQVGHFDHSSLRAFPTKFNIPGLSVHLVGCMSRCRWGEQGSFWPGILTVLTGPPPSAHNTPVSQLSAPPARKACFSQALTPALPQTPERREGALWHIACNPSISALRAGLGLHLPPLLAPSCCHDRLCNSGDPGQPDAGGQGEEGQRHGWGDAICQGAQLRADAANSCPSRPRQLIVGAAGGRRALRALLGDIPPFSSLP